MKMVKSLLLGSAAGLVAIAGAQAADLPVKAKPVQYVKICSLYGVGFYYIPGTDMCLKIGGWVRTYNLWGADGDSTNGALATGYQYNRSSIDYDWKVRGYFTADARNQTPYGTVRAYIDVGLSGDRAASFSSNRAFIQWAGFTFGLAQSFYDFYSAPAVAFFGGHIQPSSDTGDGGQYVMAYTAQFGNGLSATISTEGPTNNRQTTLVGTGVSSAPTGIAAPGDASGGTDWPDIVGNIRVDQAWGSAQIMGAIHEVHSLYYAGPTLLGGAAHPGDDTGWAVGGGLKLNAPMIGKGDYFQTQVNYAEGASGYVAAGNVSYEAYGPGGEYGYGWTTDGVYSTVIGSNIELTTAWGVNASYEHHWNDQWKTSVYGGYIDFNYSSVANATLCDTFMTFMSSAKGNGACNNDWSYYDVGTRTIWNVTKDFYLGVDVVYTHLNTASAGMLTNIAAVGTQPAGVHTLSDQDAWIVNFRVHKDFYP
jgi:Porin subfamily